MHLVSVSVKNPCVFIEVSRASCISITLRDKYRLLDWQYSGIFACAELHSYCSLKLPTMPREKTIRVRLSDAEYEALKNHADKTNRMLSEVIRDFIKGLMRKPS